MNVSVSESLAAPPVQVWAAVRDRDVLAVAIPGCERLKLTGPASAELSLAVRAAAVGGSYLIRTTSVVEQDQRQLTVVADAAGQLGSVHVSLRLSVRAEPGGGSRLDMTADLTPGERLAAVGQRMLAAVASRLAVEFARALDRHLAAGTADRPAVPAQAGPPGGPLPPAQAGPPPAGIPAQRPRPAIAAAVAAGLAAGLAAGILIGRRTG